MISIDEAQELMEKFIELRTKLREDNSDKNLTEFKRHEHMCIDKFSYLITMKTGRYKAFANYDDLNQEGMEALVMAMKNYNPKKGNWFWWAHKYIDTRIARSANLHTAIRYPLKVAKSMPPHKEAIMPAMYDDQPHPEKALELSQTEDAVRDSIVSLPPEQIDVIKLAFGFEGDRPSSINKICKQLNISRSNCIKAINHALASIKQNIKI